MHDEFERALGVRKRPGVSLLGWIGIGLVALFLLGATGLFFAFRAVSDQVHEVVERVRVGSPAEAPRMVARTVARTLGEMGTASSVDEDRIASAVARALSVSGQDRVTFQEGAAALPGEVRARGRPPGVGAGTMGGEEMEGFLRIRTDEGEIRADLRAGEDGGSLVVRGEDGEVLVDLSGDARGGRLYLRGEGEVASFQTGDHAARPPRWVPPVDGRANEMQRVLSGHAGEGTFGAQTWLTDASPEALVQRFRERLLGEGWEVRAEHRLRDRAEASASVVGRRDGMGRTVLLTAGLEAGRTRVVLGWGQEAPSRR